VQRLEPGLQRLMLAALPVQRLLSGQVVDAGLVEIAGCRRDEGADFAAPRLDRSCGRVERLRRNRLIARRGGKRVEHLPRQFPRPTERGQIAVGMVVPQIGFQSCVDGLLGVAVEPGQRRAVRPLDAGDFGPPVGQHAIVVDEHARQVAGVGLGRQHVGAPKQH